MLPFSTLIIPDKNAATPVYLQISNRLIHLIRDGVIRPGADLPGSREMSKLLNVHRKTVVAAYEELNAQDWIETIPRKGVLVTRKLPEIKPRSFKAAVPIPAYAGNTGFAFNKHMSFPSSSAAGSKHRLVINDGFPDIRLAPMEALLREYRNLVSHRYTHATAGDAAGARILREALVPYLSTTRGLNIQPGNVMITRGAQMSIYLAANLLLQPGDHVIVGAPNYYLANLIFEHTGAKLIQVPVDDQGMDIEVVAAICKRKKIRALYVIPHHHHPTTVTLSAERRMQLLELVRKYRLAVIEDDYDYSFHYDCGPILPLASTNHDGCVIYIGSATKAIAPSVRIGFMIAPENFIQQATSMRRLIDLRGDSLMEAALGNLINNGDLGRHLKKSNKIYHQRRDFFCDMIDKYLPGIIQYKRPAGGMSIWAPFNKKYPLPAVAAKASSLGLYLSEGSPYNTSSVNYNALRIGFASLNEKEIEEVVGILVKATNKK